MKHTLLFISILLSGFGYSQIISFPDANFKAKLIALNLDTNNDGEIEQSEVENIDQLDVSNSGIADLTGISFFTGMTYLDCSNNQLTSLIIDPNIMMEVIIADHNQISTYSATTDPQIGAILNLSYNNLTSFSASNTHFEDDLNLSHNQLTSISLSNLSIGYFNIEYNMLSSLNFSGNVYFIQQSYFRNNQFSLLDLSGAGFGGGSMIYFGDNVQDRILFATTSQPGQINYSSNNTFVDFGNWKSATNCEPDNTGMLSITNSPNLEKIILKNGFVHGNVDCSQTGDGIISALFLQLSGVPSLNQICTDGGQEATNIQTYIDTLNLTSQVAVNSDCQSTVLKTQEFTTADKFVIAPLPADNFIELTSPQNLKIDGIEIFNVLGQSIFAKIGNQQSVDISNLASGNYFMNIKSSEITTVKRFVKR